MAGSKAQGRLVAPRTRIPVSSFPTPCICTKNSVFALLLDSFSPSDLLPVIESTSSMKMIAGFCSLAISKSYLISRSVSPTYLLMRSEEEIEKKVASHSLAHAFARKVFPVPGGPYSRIPFHGSLTPLKKSGNFIGSITASFNACFAPSNPATSDHFIFGFVVTIASDNAFFSLSVSLSPSLIFYFLFFEKNYLLFFFFFYFVLSSFYEGWEYGC